MPITSTCAIWPQAGAITSSTFRQLTQLVTLSAGIFSWCGVRSKNWLNQLAAARGVLRGYFWSSNAVNRRGWLRDGQQGIALHPVGDGWHWPRVQAAGRLPISDQVNQNKYKYNLQNAQDFPASSREIPRTRTHRRQDARWRIYI